MTGSSTRYTPQNKGAGRERMLAFGVSQRIETMRTNQLVVRILYSMKADIAFSSGDWVLRWKGFTCMVPYMTMVSMMSEWKSICETNMPVLHVFESSKMIVISSTTGVFIRPMRTFPEKGKFSSKGPYENSMAIYHSDTMKFLDMSFPLRMDKHDQFSSLLLLTEPFYK